jgi:peroxiredoxin
VKPLVAVVALTLAMMPLSPPSTHAVSSPPPVGARAPLDLIGPEPPVAWVSGGEHAPNVSWQSEDGQWIHLSDLRAHGSVLLVIAPHEPELAALQRERGRLMDIDVLPVAVLDRRTGTTFALARRLGLDYVVVPDPLGVVAEQFNALDPDSRHAAPAWFVIDSRGVVRAVGRGPLPMTGWSSIAATALSLPLPGATLPTSSR